MMLKRISSAQKGFVLVVVLGAIILMSVLLLGFNRKCRAGLRDMDDFTSSQQARNYARAGLNIALAVVRHAPRGCADANLARLFAAENTFEFDGGACSVTIQPENARLNVNLLKDKNGMLDRTRIDQLLRLIDLLNRKRSGRLRLSYNLVPSIIDWTDRDDEVTCLPFVKYENSGAEKSYYNSLNVPSACKNAPLDTTEELLFVRAMTPQVFEDIRDYLTVYGDGEVNINSAPQRVIESLSEEIDAALAKMIVDRRKFRPFGSVEELRDVPGMTDSIYNKINSMLTVAAAPQQYYNVVSRANVDGLRCTAEAVLRRSAKTKSVDVVLYEEF